METTKTSVKIAKALRKAGFLKHQVFWYRGGYRVDVYYNDPTAFVTFLGATAKTITAAYRDVWRQYKENQSDG